MHPTDVFGAPHVVMKSAHPAIELIGGEFAHLVVRDQCFEFSLVMGIAGECVLGYTGLLASLPPGATDSNKNSAKVEADQHGGKDTG